MFSHFLQVIQYFKRAPVDIINRNIDAAGRDYLEIIHGYSQRIALLLSYHDSNSCSKCRRADTRQGTEARTLAAPRNARLRTGNVGTEMTARKSVMVEVYCMITFQVTDTLGKS